MTLNFGTLALNDTLGAKITAENVALTKYDPQQIYSITSSYLAAYERIQALIFSPLVVDTTERFIPWGGYDNVDMQEGDEYSRPDVQKLDITPTAMGFVLKLMQAGYGVTRLFMETKGINDLEKVINGIVEADRRYRIKAVTKTIFNPTNNLTYKDRLVDNMVLPIRTFLNADGTVIPPDQWGNTFDPATHTHFIGAATLTNTGPRAIINTVREHYADGDYELAISAADETAFTALSDFKPYPDPRIRVSYNTDMVTGKTLDIWNSNNRAIGIFGAAEVCVRPWVPAGYEFAYNRNGPKPLRRRIRTAERGNLRIASDLDIYPLMARFMEREEGFGVYERTNGACLYVGNSTYQAPTL